MYIMLSKEVFYFSYQANKSTCSELIAMKRGYALVAVWAVKLR